MVRHPLRPNELQTTLDSQQQVHVFVLPYLADYREGFFAALEAQLDDELVLVHPPKSLGGAVRVLEHERSNFSEPVRRLLGGFESQRRLVRNVARLQPDSIVIEANVRDLSYVRLLLWCKFRRVPVAIWGLGRYNRERSLLEWSIGNAMTWLLVRLSDAVIGKGVGPAAYYSRFTLDRSKVTHAPNSSGIEDALTHITRTARPPISVEKPLRILYVGRITAAKDLDLLLRALAGDVLADQWRLDIVGEGPAKGDLQSLAEQLEVTSNVTYHGTLRGADLVERYAAADVLTLPGKGGLVIPEALASGLPIILGPLEHAGDGTLGELLTDGGNAWIAPQLGFEGLRSATAAAIEAVDAGQLPRMQAAARASYERHGGVSAMAEVFARFLKGSPWRGQDRR